MTGLETTKVLYLIRGIVSGNIVTAELNLFITFCRGYSKACLLNEIQFGRLDLNHSLVNQDQLDDFALDCIADLFARDRLGELFLLKRFFEPQIAELIRTPQRAIPVLRKLIASRVHQSLIALFSRVDRGGWKIWRNLSLVTKRHPHLREFLFLGRTYLYYHDQVVELRTPDDLNPREIPIPDELLREKLQASLKKVYGLPQAVSSVLKWLRSQRVHQQFLARGQIYHVLKDLLNINYMDVEEIESLVGVDPVSQPGQHEIGEVINEEEIQSYLHQQLHTRYVDKGKIDDHLCCLYQEILGLYFSDLLKDGFVEKLPQYLLLSRQPDLDSDTWLVHRGRLEYMIKLGKMHIRDVLEAHDFLRDAKMGVYS